MSFPLPPLYEQELKEKLKQRQVSPSSGHWDFSRELVQQICNSLKEKKNQGQDAFMEAISQHKTWQYGYDELIVTWPFGTKLQLKQIADQMLEKLVKRSRKSNNLKAFKIFQINEGEKILGLFEFKQPIQLSLFGFKLKQSINVQCYGSCKPCYSIQQYEEQMIKKGGKCIVYEKDENGVSQIGQVMGTAEFGKKKIRKNVEECLRNFDQKIEELIKMRNYLGNQLGRLTDSQSGKRDRPISEENIKIEEGGATKRVKREQNH